MPVNRKRYHWKKRPSIELDSFYQYNQNKSNIIRKNNDKIRQDIASFFRILVQRIFTGQA